jgi:hypothetical protein
MTQSARETKRVAIYVRRSIDDGDATCSLPEQERACRVYAEGIGNVVRVFKENESGVSGFDRPIFLAMVAAAERQEFESIVCLDVSRFGRFDVDERGFWITRLRRSRVEVRFVHDDARLVGEAGAIMGAVLQHSAREHSVKTALRVTMGHVAAVERGCWPGGKAPFGYRLVRREGWNGSGRRDSKLVVFEPEAKIVRDAFKLYASGKGSVAVCDALNRKEYRTRAGRHFGASALQRILANPTYKGDVVRSQERRGWKPAAGKYGSKFYHGSSHGVVPVGSETDGYANAGAAPVIIDVALWERVQEIARSRAVARTGGRKPGLFAGLAWCGVCNGRLAQRAGRTVKGRRYGYLGCRSCRERGLAASYGECGRVCVSYNKLLDRILELLREEALKVDPASIEAEVRKRLAVGKGDVDVAALETRRKRLATRRRDLILADTDFERAALKELAAEDARLASQIEAAKRDVGCVPDIEERVKVAVDAARAIEAGPTAEGEEALRSALRVFVERIVVRPADRAAPKPVDVTLYTVPGEAFPLSDRLLVSEAELALERARIDSSLDDQVGGLEPRTERLLRSLEQRARRERCLFPTARALPQSPGRAPTCRAPSAARTHESRRPAEPEEPLTAGFLGAEATLELLVARACFGEEREAREVHCELDAVHRFRLPTGKHSTCRATGISRWLSGEA